MISFMSTPSSNPPQTVTARAEATPITPIRRYRIAYMPVSGRPVVTLSAKTP
jgi:hypothetical protein